MSGRERSAGSGAALKLLLKYTATFFLPTFGFGTRLAVLQRPEEIMKNMDTLYLGIFQRLRNGTWSGESLSSPFAQVSGKGLCDLLVGEACSERCARP